MNGSNLFVSRVGIHPVYMSLGDFVNLAFNRQEKLRKLHLPSLLRSSSHLLRWLTLTEWKGRRTDKNVPIPRLMFRTTVPAKTGHFLSLPPCKRAIFASRKREPPTHRYRSRFSTSSGMEGPTAVNTGRRCGRRGFVKTARGKAFTRLRKGGARTGSLRLEGHDLRPLQP